ncbi:MAG: hypothetical protein AAFR93_06870 [Pseudomonadota bacterium]
MAKIAELEARLDAALAKIRQAPKAGASDPSETQALQAALDGLRAERDRDVAELDALLAKLKPLIEEAS